ncbi:CHAT domain-containing protein [Pantanalinema sp. GBBB05]|uniref:CHAT domain-containing protein n=1 Tax=Pantanalinema sp. GBBB05 TaxID=2604139 RepID=UPI001D4D4104|nr:CHAT domain-containing protein [Pantanalinema sp. GBBB05]
MQKLTRNSRRSLVSVLFSWNWQRWLYGSLGITGFSLTIATAPAIAWLQPTSSTTAPAIVTPDPISVTDWLEQGQQFYRAGRFWDAITAWKTATQQFQNQGDLPNAALSLSYLSLAQQELKQWEAAQQSIDQSLHLLQSGSTSVSDGLWVHVLNTQATLQFNLNQLEKALATWKTVERYQQKLGSLVGRVNSQIRQAQVLSSLGLYRQSQQQLAAVRELLMALPNSVNQVNGLRSLGLALRWSGELEASEQVFAQSLTIAHRSNASSALSSILFNLGSIALDQNRFKVALEYFQQSEAAATNTGDRLSARLAQFDTLLRLHQFDQATLMAPDLWQQLLQQPPGRASLNATIYFVKLLNQVDTTQQFLSVDHLLQLMVTTVQSAQQIQDAQVEANALQQWGQLYRRMRQWSEAIALTQNALDIARRIQANELVSQSAWRLGQLYQQRGQRSLAIKAYTEAIQAAKQVRVDLLMLNSDISFSFGDSVEPIYRDLVGLLLDGQPKQAELVQSQGLLESLQRAELKDFFRSARLAIPAGMLQTDPSATVIYPFLLPDRLLVMVARHRQPLHYYTVRQSPAEIERTLDQLLVSLHPLANAQEQKRLLQQVYNWIIRPLETDQILKKSTTLVFVLNGQFRNIPVAALHDGQHYLIEKYAIALSPGLQLMSPRSSPAVKQSAVVAGISQARSGFSALPGVETEIQQLTQKLSASRLLNQEFTREALANQLKSSPANIVHLATHGQFSSKLNSTFLLTWNDRLTINDLQLLLRQRSHVQSRPIDLLVLSACETAEGDRRATLGLAGMAVSSGASSTLATLWAVNDAATTQLMGEFYQAYLNQGLGRAAALQAAQLALLKHPTYNQPFYWSPFILVGDWW